MGCDIRLIFITVPSINFNPRTHVGCDTAISSSAIQASWISIHAPTWGATLVLIAYDAVLVISIHAPTWGATYGRRLQHSVQAISIHAPTWGATSRLAADECMVLIFQSTHPRGVRHSDVAPLTVELQFQSTHPRGVRPVLKVFRGYTTEISIHAPTWGATRAVLAAGKIVQFQSTHPRGVRPQ